MFTYWVIVLFLVLFVFVCVHVVVVIVVIIVCFFVCACVCVFGLLLIVRDLYDLFLVILIVLLCHNDIIRSIAINVNMMVVLC